MLTCLLSVLDDVWVLLGKQEKGQPSTLYPHTKGRAVVPAEELTAPARCSWMEDHGVLHEPWGGVSWGLILISEWMLRLSKNNHISEAIYLLLYIFFYLQVMLYCTYHTSMLLYRISKEDASFTKIFKNCPFFPLLLEYIQLQKGIRKWRDVLQPPYEVKIITLLLLFLFPHTNTQSQHTYS